MPNLALSKLPLEKDKWISPEEATNGVIINYTGENGFAHAKWPCTFTLDLENTYPIHLIRILLWDNQGRPTNKINGRKYRFSLSLSSDGVNFTQFYSNLNSEGANGWYIFRFNSETYGRFVRLEGHHNSINEEFHIVEFEIYDTDPSLTITSNNKREISIASTFVAPTEDKIKELIDNYVSTKSALLGGIDDKLLLLESSLNKSSQALEQIELIKTSTDFKTESDNNQSRAYKWIIAATCAFVVFIGTLIYFILCDEHSKSIIQNAYNDIALRTYTPVLLAAFYATKAILVSTLLFLFGWFLKNYRSEKHNYVINKHKAMSLTVATGILTKDNYKNTDREAIFNQAMQVIFSHQISGFNKDETSSPTVLNTILEKTADKVVK